jgi:hypothetical protein
LKAGKGLNHEIEPVELTLNPGADDARVVVAPKAECSELG